MATTVVLASPATRRHVLGRFDEDRRYPLLLTAACTLFTLALHGYHPFAEDGGLYLAGVKYLLNPALYPHGTEFVTAHLRYSIFAPLVAGLVRGSGAPLEDVAFVLYLAMIWLTLAAAWKIVSACFSSRAERTGSLLLLTCWMTLPIAGTSLMLVDPYLTARSFSTPCVLFALAFVLRAHPARAHRGSDLFKAGAALALGAAFHPLMAAYGTVAVAAVLLARRARLRTFLVRMLALLGCGLLLALLLQHLTAPETPAAEGAALSRDYWYLAEWRWFELLGLAGPVSILVLFARRARAKVRALTLAILAVSMIFFLVALCFARPELGFKELARLQPLRIFQLTYIVMIFMLGALLGRLLLREELWRWSVAAAVLGVPMFFAQRSIYPDLPHLELPQILHRPNHGNDWTEAFLWIRRSTPTNALFALDANYINRPREDAQSFRAIAERSMLPDLSKDGGEAAITPALAASWQAGANVQRGLSAESDTGRRGKLLPLGVNWLVLDRAAPTALPCSYENGTVKVCRLTAGN